MQPGLSPLIRFITRNLVALGAIALVIVIGRWALGEYRALQSARADMAILSGVAAPLERHRQERTLAVEQRLANYRAAPLAALEERIAALRRELDNATKPPSASLLTFPLADPGQIGARLLRQYEERIGRELQRQELAYLEQLQALAYAGINRNQATLRLEELRQAHVQAYQRYTENAQAFTKLGWLDRQLTGMPQLGSTRLAALDEERRRIINETRQAHVAYELQRNALARIGPFRPALAFAADRQRLDAALAPLTAHIDKTTALVSTNMLSRLWQPFRQALPTAALILALGFLIHLAVKAFFYFVLAPMASRLRPIRLDPGLAGRVSARGAQAAGATDIRIASAVSQSVVLEPDEELLILPDFIQSSSATSSNRTRWLLDWSHPWTSLIAGMVGLTSIRSKGAAPVVISASDDATSEIAVMALPPGSAMVLQPRCLVGVVCPVDAPLRITARWRLGSLHAWLTLQLRYLVFHGPATLIVKGSRGVRVEPAGQGRLISQASTLGFSANLDYSTVRCETFFPYYIGKSALLLDRFEGGPGFYVYDETPRGGKNASAIGRGLEGMADAVLKVFGI